MRVKLEDCKLTNEEYNELGRSLYFQQNFFKLAFSEGAVKEIGARVFADDRAYIKYSKRMMGYNPNKHNAAAYYSPKENEIVIHKSLDNFIHVFRHELSHGLYFMYCESAPQWLVEGSAELLEDIQLNAQEKYEFDGVPYSRKYARMIEVIDGKGSIEWLREENFKGDQDAYTMSWGVVNYFYRTNPDFLFEIMRESCNVTYKSMDRVYPGGIKALEADVFAFYLMNVN